MVIAKGTVKIAISCHAKSEMVIILLPWNEYRLKIPRGALDIFQVKFNDALLPFYCFAAIFFKNMQP